VHQVLGDAITVLVPLRKELLCERAVALAGPVPRGLEHTLRSLGARTETLPGGAADEAALEAWAQERAPLRGLVYDAAAAFGGGGEAAIQAALEQAWVAVRAVAVGALIDGEQGGKIVVVAPRAGAGALVLAAAAALENLARTLSVEWARYAITATAVVPGPEATEQQLAELVCFLISPAGDYFSGCRFDLGGSPW
jgi:NAD(P)-dependent dehydrogenase (short-subunit alcohol dehydrogenase family)